jgi:hypothetical protein
MDSASTPTRPRSRTLSRLLRVTLAVVLATSAIVGVAAWNASSAERAARRASIESLSTALGVDALEDAVGRLGVLLRLPSGAWIAISYEDSHAGHKFFSCSVALCSDGTWLHSDHHFCGEFAAYRSNKEWLAQATTDDERATVEAIIQEEALHAVESAPDLPAAKARLRERGFRDFTPSADLIGSAPPGAPTP